MPLIFTTTGGTTRPRVYVQGEDRARGLNGRPPRATMLRVHANRLFAAGDPSHPSRLHFSEYLNAEQWEPVAFESQNQAFLIPADAGFIEVEPNDGQKIRAIGLPFQGVLPIYKDHSIYKLYGSDPTDFRIEVMTASFGCVSHFAVTNSGGDQVFVSRAGVHSLAATDNFGDLEQSTISRDIRDYWNEEVNVEALQNACFAVDNEPLDRIEILVPIHDASEDATTPNRILCLHYGVRPQEHPFGLWSVKKISGRSMAMTRLQGASRERVIVGSTDGYLNLQDQKAAIDFPEYGRRTVVVSGALSLRSGGTGDNIEANLTDQTVDVALATIRAGFRVSKRRAIGVRIPTSGTTIPAKARILRARLRLTAVNALATVYTNLRIRGELNVNASDFSANTWNDYNDRTRTIAFVDWHNVEATSAATNFLTPDISSIVQEIVNLSGWQGDGTDNLVFFLEDHESFQSGLSSGDPYRDANGGANQMQLHLAWWSP